MVTVSVGSLFAGVSCVFCVCVCVVWWSQIVAGIWFLVSCSLCGSWIGVEGEGEGRRIPLCALGWRS